MNILIRARTLFLFAAILPGCAPVLHSVTTVPGVEGRVTRSGSPVGNAQVSAGASSSGVPCEWKKTDVHKTDNGGVFRIPAQSDLRVDYQRSMSSLSVNTFEVCIEHDGRSVLGYRGLNFQPRTATVILACDLDRQYPQAERGLQGACQFVPVPTREGASY